MSTTGSAGRGMSLLLVAGVAVFGIAAVTDIAVHLLGAAASWQTPAHVMTLVGMALTLAGVVGSGRSSHRHHQPSKETRHAIR